MLKVDPAVDFWSNITEIGPKSRFDFLNIYSEFYPTYNLFNVDRDSQSCRLSYMFLQSELDKLVSFKCLW